MSKFLDMVILTLYIFVYIMTAIVIGCHIYFPFSNYLIVYDLLFIGLIFIFPRIFKDKIYFKEGGFNDWYLVMSQLILIACAYYIIEYVYKL